MLDKLHQYKNLYDFVKSEISDYHFDKWRDDSQEQDINYQKFKIHTDWQKLIDNFQGVPGTDPDLTRPTQKHTMIFGNRLGMIVNQHLEDVKIY